MKTYQTRVLNTGKEDNFPRCASVTQLRVWEQLQYSKINVTNSCTFFGSISPVLKFISKITIPWQLQLLLAVHDILVHTLSSVLLIYEWVDCVQTIGKINAELFSSRLTK